MCPQGKIVIIVVQMGMMIRKIIVNKSNHM